MNPCHGPNPPYNERELRELAWLYTSMAARATDRRIAAHLLRRARGYHKRQTAEAIWLYRGIGQEAPMKMKAKSDTDWLERLVGPFMTRVFVVAIGLGAAAILCAAAYALFSAAVRILA